MDTITNVRCACDDRNSWRSGELVGNKMLGSPDVNFRKSLPDADKIETLLCSDQPTHGKFLGKGAYGTVRKYKIDHVASDNAKANQFCAVKDFGRDSESCKYEVDVNKILNEAGQNMTNETEAYFHHCAGFVTPMLWHKIEKNSSLIAFGMAPGKALGEAFRRENLEQEVEAEKNKNVNLSPHDQHLALQRLKRSFLNEKLCIAAQILDALAYLHHCGLINRDIKASNIVYHPEAFDSSMVQQNPKTRSLKLIDLGLAISVEKKFEDTGVYKNNLLQLSCYCASLEQYVLLQKINACEEEIGKINTSGDRTCLPAKKQELTQLFEDLSLITTPSVDVYGFGLLAIALFFGQVGHEKWLNLFNGDDCIHDDADKNIEIRQKFYKDVGLITTELNLKLPEALRYSNKELNFMNSFIRSCIDPNPLARPTSSQAAAIVELWAAEAINHNFHQIIGEAAVLRPSNPLPAATIEAYKRHVIISGDTNPSDEKSDVETSERSHA
jgi:serine/threonine protein kinase